MRHLDRGYSLLDRKFPVLGIYLRFIKHRLTGNRELRVAKRFVVPNAVVIDVGARRGIYTWMMSELVGELGSVLAFEPNPHSATLLRKVFSGRRNVTVHECALSDTNGEGILHVPSIGGNGNDALGSLSARNFDGAREVLAYPVSLKCLDELVEPPMRVSFMKIDVEGHELAVLKGARRMIARDRPVVFAEIEQRHIDERIEGRFEWMEQFGYSTYFLALDGSLQPLSRFKLREMQLVPYAEGRVFVNMFLFLPDGSPGTLHDQSEATP